MPRYGPEGAAALGVTKGSKVAVMLANRPEFVVAAYGATLIGVVAVPVSTLAAADERDYISGTATPVLVTQASLVDRRFVDELIADHPDIGDAEPGRIGTPASRTCVASCASAPFPGPAASRAGRTWSLRAPGWTTVLDAAAASVVPSDDALIIYTSGTTAHPKAVLHRQRGPVVQSWRWREQLGLDPVRSGLEPVPVLLDRRAGVRTGRDAGVRCVLRVPGGVRCRRGARAARAGADHHRPHVPPLGRRPGGARGRPQAGPVVATAGGAGQRPAAVGPDRGGSRRPAGRIRADRDVHHLHLDPLELALELRETTHGVTLPGMAIRIVDPDTGEPLGVGRPVRSP